MNNQIQCVIRHCPHNKLCGCKKNKKHLNREKFCENYQDPGFSKLHTSLQQFLRVHENPRYLGSQICANHSEIFLNIESFLQKDHQNTYIIQLKNFLDIMKPDSLLLFHSLTRNLMMKLSSKDIDLEQQILIYKLIRKYTQEAFLYNNDDQTLILNQIINNGFLKIGLFFNKFQDLFSLNNNNVLQYELLLGIITNISLTIKQQSQLENELQLVYKKVKQSFQIFNHDKIITANILFLKYFFQIEYFERQIDLDFYLILEYICINFRQMEILLQQDIIKIVSMKIFNDYEQFRSKQIQLNQDYNQLYEKFVENCVLNQKLYSLEINYFLEKLIQKR